MTIKDNSYNTALPHQLFSGTTWHSRLLPKVHKFVYPYRYWGVNISALADGVALPEVSMMHSKKSRRLKNLMLFSMKKKALQQFCPEDYLQKNSVLETDSVPGTDSQVENNIHSQELDDSDLCEPNGCELNDCELSSSELSEMQALKRRLQQAFTERAGSAPTGEMLGLVVCRNAGLYFSPVNFYLGFDQQQMPSHLLAEVSNTPWDKRHYYGFSLAGEETEFCHDKDFHVSPFNPIDQLYRWQVKVKRQPDNGLQVRITIDISDERGEVLKTGIKMEGVAMSDRNIRNSLRKNPLMNITSLARIYGHAFKLYAIKKVPYVNYDEKLADSQQSKSTSSKSMPSKK